MFLQYLAKHNNVLWQEKYSIFGKIWKIFPLKEIVKMNNFNINDLEIW